MSPIGTKIFMKEDDFALIHENCLTGYGRRKSKDISIREKVKRFGSIHNIGPYEQLAENLLTIDGPGLGKSGSKIEHIDDLFLEEIKFDIIFYVVLTRINTMEDFDYMEIDYENDLFQIYSMFYSVFMTVLQSAIDIEYLADEFNLSFERVWN